MSREDERVVWEKTIHAMSQWQRRAIVAVSILAGKTIPDYLQEDAKWVSDEIERRKADNL